MTTKAIDKPAKSDRSAVARRATRAPAAAKTEPRKLEPPPVQPRVEGHVTKHAQFLNLLNRPEGEEPIVDLLLRGSKRLSDYLGAPHASSKKNGRFST